MAHTHLQQPLLGIDDYTEAVRLDPAHTHAFNNRAASYIELRQPEMALADTEQAIRLDGQLSSAFALRAIALTFLWREADAELDAGRATTMGFDGRALDYLILRAKQRRIPLRPSTPP